MITDKIKALFQFIEFLHSNIENFKQYDNLIDELYLLVTERKELKYRNNFKEKLKYDEIQGRIKDKYKIVEENILEPIESKLLELIKCNWKEPGIISLIFEQEILILKEKVTIKDIPIIKQGIEKYIDFKERTKWPYFIDNYFDEIDDILKKLYNYFIAEEETENTQTILISNTSSNESKERISNSLQDFFFFQVYFETENGKEKNNDSIITPENWESLKDIFFKQRMEKYKASYNLTEKIKLELENLENLIVNKTDYKILKERYKDHLKTIEHQKIENEQARREPDLDEHLDNILDIIKPLSGYWNSNKIMKQGEFEILKTYLFQIYRDNRLPSNIPEFQITNVSKEFISKTIHRVYKYSGKKNKFEFINLIHSFRQFNNTEKTTTNSKFSAYSGNYENDIETRITY